MKVSARPEPRDDTERGLTVRRIRFLVGQKQLELSAIESVGSAGSEVVLSESMGKDW